MALHFGVESQSSSISREGSPNNDESEILIVILHGILNSFDRISPIANLAQSTFDGAEVWTPKLPYRGFRGLFDFTGAPEIVEQLSDDLNLIWESGHYKSIKIVGHSMGGIIARDLLLKGRQQRPQRREGKPEIGTTGQSGRRHWADSIDNANAEDRLVLLAAANRGAGPTRHMGLLSFLAASLAIWFANLLDSIGKPPTLLAAARGSKYLTDLRLNWLIENNRQPLPVTIQLLGSTDDVVGPDDSLDLITGENFRYIDIENTGHLSILDVDEEAPTPSRFFLPWTRPEQVKKIKAQRRRRREIVKIALALHPNYPEFEKLEVRPWGLSEISEEENRRRHQVEDVIFVIHGIRDQGHWTDKIARRIWKNAGKDRRNKIEKVVDSYGYFGMGPFLFSKVRRKKVGWFMEQYIEARSMYPDARFHFVGHSHGTYLLAKSIEDHKKCIFDNIVFAGSIVRSSFDWNSRINETKQINKVLNIVATHDWVVAWFPRFFDFYNLQDIGGAGHVGFHQSSESGPIYTLRYAKGAHSAATKEHWWDTIANFVLSGDVITNVTTDKSQFSKNRLLSIYGAAVSFISYLNFIIWISLVIALVFLVPLGIINLMSYTWAIVEKHWPTVSQNGDWNPMLIGVIGILAVGYALFIRRQAKYRRRLGWLRSIAVLPIIGATAWLVSEWFGSWYLASLSSASDLGGFQLIATICAVFVWFIGLLWLLRKA